jgi:hypothetical protein
VWQVGGVAQHKLSCNVLERQREGGRGGEDENRIHSVQGEIRNLQMHSIDTHKATLESTVTQHIAFHHNTRC